MLCLIPALLLVSGVYASNTDLLSVLSTQANLTRFTSLVNTYPALLAVAQTGDKTIIAPNDEAFTTFFANPSSAGNYSSPDQLYALMQYHILTGTHSSESITSTPSFISSLLTNSSYTNVTTGAVVEAVANQTSISFRSAVHQVSTIVGSNVDIIFVGGFIHIVDTVMIPPLNSLATATEYPLTYFIEDLASMLNTNFSQLTTNITNFPNQTYLVANNKTEADSALTDPQAGLTDYVVGYFNYCNIPDEVVYTTAMTNGSKWRTRGGLYLTITEFEGDIYVNDAKIIIRDLLIANGVMQILDRTLNASTPNARPQLYNTTSPPSNTTSSVSKSSNTNGAMSTGAKAGIGIGVTFGAIAVVAVIFLLLRGRQQPALMNEKEVKSVQEAGSDHVVEVYSRRPKYEMGTRPYDAAELDAGMSTPELAAETDEQHIISPLKEDSR